MSTQSLEMSSAERAMVVCNAATSLLKSTNPTAEALKMMCDALLETLKDPEVPIPQKQKNNKLVKMIGVLIKQQNTTATSKPTMEDIDTQVRKALAAYLENPDTQTFERLTQFCTDFRLNTGVFCELGDGRKTCETSVFSSYRSNNELFWDFVTRVFKLRYNPDTPGTPKIEVILKNKKLMKRICANVSSIGAFTIVSLSPIGHDDQFFEKYPWMKPLLPRGAFTVFNGSEPILVSAGMQKFTEITPTDTDGVFTKMEKMNGAAGSMTAVPVDDGKLLIVAGSKTATTAILVDQDDWYQDLLAFAAANRDGRENKQALIALAGMAASLDEAGRQSMMGKLLGGVVIVEIMTENHFVLRASRLSLAILQYQVDGVNVLDSDLQKQFVDYGFIGPLDMTDMDDDHLYAGRFEGYVLYLDGVPVQKVKFIWYTFCKFVLRKFLEMLAGKCKNTFSDVVKDGKLDVAAAVEKFLAGPRGTKYSSADADRLRGSIPSLTIAADRVFQMFATGDVKFNELYTIGFGRMMAAAEYDF